MTEEQIPDNPPEEVTLRTLMRDAKLTEPELSKKLGVSLRIINYWKNRRKVPTLESAASLASELGVSMKTVCTAFGIDISRIPDDTQGGEANTKFTE